MSTLIKVIKNDRTPVLRNLVVLPLLVQQEQDPDLQVLHMYSKISIYVNYRYMYTITVK